MYPVSDILKQNTVVERILCKIGGTKPFVGKGNLLSFFPSVYVDKELTNDTRSVNRPLSYSGVEFDSVSLLVSDTLPSTVKNSDRSRHPKGMSSGTGG